MGGSAAAWLCVFRRACTRVRICIRGSGQAQTQRRALSLAMAKFSIWTAEDHTGSVPLASAVCGNAVIIDPVKER